MTGRIVPLTRVCRFLADTMREKALGA